MDRSAPLLIVDDDPIFLAVTEGIVASLGFTNVLTAVSASDGLNALTVARHSFRLIILDLNMPGIDGLAFLREASSLGFAGGVIISSGETEAVLRSAGQMGRLLKINVLGTIKKPVSAERLSAVLSKGSTIIDSSPSANGRISDALSLNELELVPYYQAQHNASTGEVLGVEALIRARGADGRMHGPGKLFGQVHSEAELVAVTHAIVDKVVDDMRQWARRGVLRRTSINLDARLVEDSSFVNTLVGAVRAAGVSPDLVCWEVTEASLPQDVTRLMENLARLRMAGFHLSIDDYGTGGSNFEFCGFALSQR